MALVERSKGQCYLTVTPPMKLRARGWVPFERGPFPPSQIRRELDKQGPTIQHMVCEFLGCTREELDEKGLSDFVQAVEFYRIESSMRCLTL